MNMFFLFKNDKVNVPNLSIHIELLGCTDAQLFCDFCNEHIYTQSTEYNNIHLQPCRVFITLFKKAKYVKQINGKLVVVPDKDGNPISLKHIFKQSKQIVYKTIALSHYFLALLIKVVSLLFLLKVLNLLTSVLDQRHFFDTHLM